MAWGRIRWGAPFLLLKKVCKKISKKCDLPLDIYGSICYNNSVRRAVQKIKPPTERGNEHGTRHCPVHMLQVWRKV